MKIVSINSCNYGSTGNIMLDIADLAREQGHIYYTACPDGRSMRKKSLDNHIFIGNIVGRNLHLKFGYYTGLQGCGSVLDTWHFLRKINKIKPDVIHLHNLHNCYINLPMLFRYIKKHSIRTIWTLHDCWALTGQCPHFSMADCDKWKTGCYQCPQCNIYPETKTDRTKTMWRLKRKWFTGVESMTLVTPSKWLAGLAKQSYLKDYSVKTIYNGIDLNIFKPTSSSFRNKYGLEDKYMVLGVAFGWGERKGLDVFVELANRLDDRYKIVLVGVDEKTEKLLPSSIIPVQRTSNQTELAEIYTAADVFANPTREEVLGLVNVEANACGTPVVVFNSGGAPECICDKSGLVVECNDIDSFEKGIRECCENKIFDQNACINRAAYFSSKGMVQEYVDLYGE